MTVQINSIIGIHMHRIYIMLVLISVTNVHASTKDIFHNFTGLSLKTTNVKMGEKVYVDFHGDTKEIESVILELINKEENIMLVVGVEDLNTQNPYFVLPESTITGITYEMVSINIKCNHGSIKYSTILGKENFTNCFEKSGDVKPEESVMLGDSLTSDMKGGFDFGMKTIWLNLNGKEKPEWVDFEIKSLDEVKNII